MPQHTLDELLAESPARLAEHLGTVTVPAVPTVLALYDAGDGTDAEPEQVIGWVLALPGHGPLILHADNPLNQVSAASLTRSRTAGRPASAAP